MKSATVPMMIENASPCCALIPVSGVPCTERVWSGRDARRDGKGRLCCLEAAGNSGLQLAEVVLDHQFDALAPLFSVKRERLARPAAPRSGASSLQHRTVLEDRPFTVFLDDRELQPGPLSSVPEHRG